MDILTNMGMLPNTLLLCNNNCNNHNKKKYNNSSSGGGSSSNSKSEKQGKRNWHLFVLCPDSGVKDIILELDLYFPRRRLYKFETCVGIQSGAATFLQVISGTRAAMYQFYVK